MYDHKNKFVKTTDVISLMVTCLAKATVLLKLCHPAYGSVEHDNMFYTIIPATTLLQVHSYTNRLVYD